MDRYHPGKGKSVGIIGVPLGYGAETIGSELGASVMRLTSFREHRLAEHLELLGYEVTDHGDVEIVVPTRNAEPGENPRFLEEIYASCLAMDKSIRVILKSGQLPIILGGDHSIATGTLSALSGFYKDQGDDIGLIWFDAHADMNTPDTSPSGNSHGMPLSIILGQGNERLVDLGGFSPKFNKDYVAHIGARDLDIGEKELIRGLGMREQFFTMSDIDRHGMRECVKKSIEIASRAPGGFAVTFDVDVMDPRFAPGSGTLVRGGINYREAHLALEMIHETNMMRSFEIVEVNPILDRGNITAKLALELILSACGNIVL